MTTVTTPGPDWHTHADPDALLVKAVGRLPEAERLDGPRACGPHDRRLRLFATACARTVWDLLPTDARSAVRIAERFALGRATLDDLRAAAIGLFPAHVTAYDHALAAAGWASAAVPPRTQEVLWSPAQAARQAAVGLAHFGHPLPATAVDPRTSWLAGRAAARAFQADIVRDIFPPPGVTVTLDPEWRTSAVLDLARTMDATGDFFAVPILADALEDAGCTDGLILDQCRHPGPHVRGNWVVELLLGRL
jgi:hypothetical protein